MHRYGENVKQNTQTPQAACDLFGKKKSRHKWNVKWQDKGVNEKCAIRQLFQVVWSFSYNLKETKLLRNLWILRAMLFFHFLNRTKSINRLKKSGEKSFCIIQEARVLNLPLSFYAV